MQAYIEKAIWILLPKWLLNPNDAATANFVKGTARALARLVDLAFLVLPESIPGTSSLLVEQWSKDLDVLYDSGATLAVRQSRVASVYTAIGGQNPDYLRPQLQKEFPDVDFIERTGTSPDEHLYYRLIGTVADADEHDRLLTLVSKLFPLHLEFTDLVDIDTDDDAARVGIARTGYARTGKDIET